MIFEKVTLDNSLRIVKWIMGLTWMATMLDMEMIESADWNQDQFLEFWIPRKQAELDFIGIIGGLVAAVVTTCLSLPAIADAHWLVNGSWYCALIFSIGSVALAFQQKGALSSMSLEKEIRASMISGRPAVGPSLKRLEPHDIVAWQVPVQLLTYALGFFFFGLFGLLIRPLTLGVLGPESKSSIFVIIFSVLPLCLYYFSTWTVQKYVGRMGEDKLLLPK